MQPSYFKAPIPPDEEKRLESLKALHILDTSPEERFDRITRLALPLFKVPISTITLVDSHREWFKSCQGLLNREGKRAISFCGHAMLSEDSFIIPDAEKDQRFAGNPMVTGKPYIKFYAGVPLRAADGRRIGAFCIKDYKPRKLTKEEELLLKSFGAWVEQEINIHELSWALDAKVKAEARANELNNVLRLLNKILRHDVLNNLTTVKGNIELFIKGKKKEEETCRRVYSAVDRSAYLIQQIGHLERAVSTGEPLVPYQLRKTIEEICSYFPSIKFKIKGNGVVLADQAIFSVIENIIRNAHSHGKTNKVDIEIKEREDIVEVYIADYGIGIPDSIKNNLFKEGFIYGKTGHTGLGLYIIERTIKRYDGEIKIKNNTPRGLIFILKLKKDGFISPKLKQRNLIG